MIWFDGSEIDPKQFSGKELCEKLALEMWADCEHWSKCDEFIQNALFIIDFDTVTNMEGFSTPHYGQFTSEYYSQILKHFMLLATIKMRISLQKQVALIHITKKFLTVQKMRMNLIKFMTNLMIKLTS